MTESMQVRAAFAHAEGKVEATLNWDREHPFELRFIFHASMDIHWLVDRELVAYTLRQGRVAGVGDVVLSRHGDVLRMRLRDQTTFEFTASVLTIFIARTEAHVPIGEEVIPDSVFDKLVEDCARDAQA